MNDLKDCPFCGGKAEKQNSRSYIGGHSNGTAMVYIQCVKCGNRTIQYHWDDERLAVSAWNKRVENEE